MKHRRMLDDIYLKKSIKWLCILEREEAFEFRLGKIVLYYLLEVTREEYRQSLIELASEHLSTLRGEFMTVAESLVEEGFQKGMTIAESWKREGFEKGMAIAKAWKEEALQEGMIAAAKTWKKKMVLTLAEKNISEEEIAECAGLSMDEVAELIHENDE